MSGKLKSLYQIITSYACFGIIVKAGLVVDAAPIAYWTKHKKAEAVFSYYKNKKNATIVKL